MRDTSLLAVISGRYPPEHNGAAKIFHSNVSRMLNNSQLGLVDVHVLSRNNEIFADDRQDNVEVKRMYFGNPNNKVKMIWRLLQILVYYIVFFMRNKYRFTVVHGITVTWETLIVLRVASLYGIRTTLESTLLGDVITERPGSKIVRYVINFVKFRLLNHVSSIKVYTDGLKHELSKASYHMDDVSMIPPAMDFNIFYLGTQDEIKRIRKKCFPSAVSDTKIILYCGAVGVRKGFDLAIDAFQRYQSDNNSNVQFYAFGPLDDKYELPVLPKNSYVPCQKVNNVPELMRAADVFLLPSRLEGFGAVYTEAMASQLPVVAGRIDGVTDYISTNNLGRVVNHTCDDVYDALVDALENEDTSLMMKKAYSYVHENFLAKKLDDQLDEFWKGS